MAVKFAYVPSRSDGTTVVAKVVTDHDAAPWNSRDQRSRCMVCDRNTVVDYRPHNGPRFIRHERDWR
jgi:hypothetical protein